MSHVPLLSGYDEPTTLYYQIRLFGPISADVRQTAALSVALPISGLAGSTMLQNLDYSLPKAVAVFLYLCSALLLTVGIALGFNGIIPKKRYGYGANYAVKIDQGGEVAKSEMVAAAREFERDNIIRANETTAAVISIRNGILVFALGTVVNLYALFVSA